MSLCVCGVCVCMCTLAGPCASICGHICVVECVSRGQGVACVPLGKLICECVPGVCVQFHVCVQQASVNMCSLRLRKVSVLLVSVARGCTTEKG